MNTLLTAIVKFCTTKKLLKLMIFVVYFTHLELFLPRMILAMNNS